MILSERHFIDVNHEFFTECDNLSYLSKNLYNYCLYIWRQNYVDNKTSLSFVDLYKLVRGTKDYVALPDKVSKGTIKQLSDTIKGYFASKRHFYKHPQKYKRCPKLPKYKHKTDGRYSVIYEKGAVNKATYNKTSKIKLSRTNIHLYTNVPYDDIKCVRISKHSNVSYCIDVMYEKVTNEYVENGRVASIDIGLNNLMTMVSNVTRPIIINGRPLKSINQYYNKTKAKKQSELCEGKHLSKGINKLTYKRNNKINDYLHKSTTYIVNQLVSNNISTLVIGRNKGMKQDINIGKRNNQNFVGVPHYKIYNLLKYKCELNGIHLLENEESYTSKCSFLDDEPIFKHQSYKGRRIYRGLFKSLNGTRINADVNAAYNILKKAVLKHNFLCDGIEVLSKLKFATVMPLLVNFN